MKLGICFAGGGIKAAAHIGVIKALEEENIGIEYVGGTSSGSIITLLYSIGYNSTQIYEIFKKYSKKIKYVEITNIIRLILGILFRRKIIINGLNSGKSIEKITKKILQEKNIKSINEINKKIIIPSVDLDNGELTIFTSIKNRYKYEDNIKYIDDIEIEKAIRASCSFPGVFAPYKYKNRYLIDGGIRENVPWKILKDNGADKIISVIFENDMLEKKQKNIFEVVYDSIQILCHELSNYEMNGVDYIIKIVTKDTSLLDYNKIDYLYNLGYIIAKKRIKEIKKELENDNKKLINK